MATPIAASPIPPGLRTTLPYPESPWMVSPGVRARLQQESGVYQKTLLSEADPEYAFVQRYFGANPPRNRVIGRIYCVHNPSLSLKFESTFCPLREEAASDVFSPKWYQEDNHILRGKVMEKWAAMSSQFSPFYAQWGDRRDRFDTVKILPLWQGSKGVNCESICRTGFTFSGKHDIIHGSVGSADPSSNTDIGFFGSGIYFTPSARYAADVYSREEGHLLMAWTCMRAPYPVVADRACFPPGEPADMRRLKGLGAYQKYNAHYIPVRSVEPGNPYCSVYYPCADGQVSDADEIVVFGKDQTLPRFWVQLEIIGPTSPYAPTAPAATIHDLFQKILDLLEKPMIQSDPHVYKILEEKSEELFEQNQVAPLNSQDQDFHKWTQQLLDETGKVRSFVAKKLGVPKAVSQPAASAPVPKPAAAPPQVVPVVPKPAVVAPPQVALVAPKSMQLPALAFGRAQWAMHLGDVDEEPPLPADIEKILASPCPFWPGKKVAETHMLTLIPARVNGQPLMLKLMGELVQAPRKGNATKYRNFNLGRYTDQSVSMAHWALMTRDVLEGTRNKSYAEQKAIVAKSAGYEVPSILDATVSIFVEHVRSGVFLYGQKPWTYTCCKEMNGSKKGWQLVVGGFAPDGLPVDFGGYYGDLDYLGVACLRKFVRHEP